MRAVVESEIMMKVDVALNIRSSSVLRNLKRSAKRSAEKKPNCSDLAHAWKSARRDVRYIEVVGLSDNSCAEKFDSVCFAAPSEEIDHVHLGLER